MPKAVIVAGIKKSGINKINGEGMKRYQAISINNKTSEIKKSTALTITLDAGKIILGK